MSTKYQRIFIREQATEKFESKYKNFLSRKCAANVIFKMLFFSGLNTLKMSLTHRGPVTPYGNIDLE